MTTLAIELGYIILGLISLKFIFDIISLKLGFGTYSLILIYFPLLSLIIFGPIGQVSPSLNYSSGLIEGNFVELGFGIAYFYLVWSLLLYFFKKDIRFDFTYIKEIAKRGNIGLISTIIFSFIAIATAFLYLPGQIGGLYYSRIYNLLPGRGWNILFLISYFFVFIGKKGWLRNIVLVATPIWFILHYKRVEILGIILFYATFTYYKFKIKRIRIDKKILKIIFIVLILLLFSFIGLIRNLSDSNSVSFSQTATSLINYPTVQDVIFSSAASIEYTKVFSKVDTLLYYPTQIVPSFFHAPDKYAYEIVRDTMNTNSGMFVIGEFYMNLGFFGLLVAPFLAYFILFFPFRIMNLIFGKMGKTLTYYVLIATLPRIFWYGFIFYLKSVFLISSALLLLYLLIRYAEEKFNFSN